MNRFVCRIYRLHMFLCTLIYHKISVIIMKKIETQTENRIDLFSFCFYHWEKEKEKEKLKNKCTSSVLPCFLVRWSIWAKRTANTKIIIVVLGRLCAKTMGKHLAWAVYTIFATFELFECCISVWGEYLKTIHILRAIGIIEFRK